MRKERLDVVMAARALAPSREKAQALILAGEVRVNGQVCLKASTPLAADAVVEVKARDRYVGRGGHKLEGALRAFQLDPAGLDAIDIGASTGGFTDCLLQHGARSVVALDVGHNQLDWKIRSDPRVTVREGVNAREVEPGQFAVRFGAAVMDVSFISQKKIWPALPPLLLPGAWVVALIKPQFEVGRLEVGKGGVVTDPALHARVVDDIRSFVEGEVRFEVRGVVPSSLPGREGNLEFLICAQKPK